MFWSLVCTVAYYSPASSDINVRLADELNAPSATEALQVNYFIALSSAVFVACEDGN